MKVKRHNQQTEEFAAGPRRRTVALTLPFDRQGPAAFKAPMKTQNGSELAKTGLQIAVIAAREYLDRIKVEAEAEALHLCVKEQVKLVIGQAIADAKEAFDCGMNQMGVQTFMASMSLAGIAAGKEIENLSVLLA